MRLLIVPATIISLLVLGVGSAAAAKPSSGQPDFGPNVLIFDPSMPTSQIQAAVDAIAAQQVPNQFGTQRYALLFKPGTYGTAQNPLNFQVGYYTSVAGLGASPGDVTINGSIYVRNQCDGDRLRRAEQLLALALEPDDQRDHPELRLLHAASSGPCRRPRRCAACTSTGSTTLMDYCTGPSFASGGFIADSRFDDGTSSTARSSSGSSRNSTLDGWSNGVWNQVFSGVVGAPAQCFPGGAERLWPVHDAPDEHGDARGAVPLRRLGRPLQRLRPGGAAQLGRRGLGERPDPRLVDPDRRLLHRQARRTTRRRSTTRSRAART